MLNQCVDLPHYYEQMRYFQTEPKPQVISQSKFKSAEFLTGSHFLLQAVQSGWQKIFPSCYGVYLRFEGEGGDSVLIVVQRGRLTSFQVPDLSTMIPERRRHPADVVRYLSERHLMPVQGVFVKAEEWAKWSQTSNPWPEIFASLRADWTQLVPLKWGMVGMIASRGLLGKM
jgi:hypothetical protein